MPGQQLGRHQKATNALWHPVQPCLAQHALTLHKACLTIDQDVCQVGSTPHLSTILGGYTQRLHDLQSYFSARPEVRSHKINTREVAGHFAGLQRSANAKFGSIQDHSVACFFETPMRCSAVVLAVLTNWLRYNSCRVQTFELSCCLP